MELKILYDNEAEEGFKGSWGFSCLVGDRLLFDTGGNENILLFNMHKFDVKFENINRVFLSHQHGDHVGGIEILKELGRVKVFVPFSFSNSFKRRLASYQNVNVAEVNEAKKIAPGFITTGVLGSFIKEQSLMVKTRNGLTVITGCSHPGLEEILRVTSGFGDVYGVVGGFHGFSELEALGSMRLIAPCHCTTHEIEILSAYPRSSVRCSAGCVFEI